MYFKFFLHFETVKQDTLFSKRGGPAGESQVLSTYFKGKQKIK